MISIDIVKFKHQPGKHNQKRHGWRYGSLYAARRSMRGMWNAAERAEYRKRAGMPEPKKIEKKTILSGRDKKRVMFLQEEHKKEFDRAVGYFTTVYKKHPTFLSSDEFINEYQGYCDKGTVSARVSVEALNGILADGRMKTQFEVKDSSGQYNPGLRREAEYEGMGIAMEGDLSERPVYGYVSIPGRASLASGYGSVELQFKDDVKNRTSVTCGDSLYAFHDGSLMASPMKKIGAESITSDGSTIQDILRSKNFFDAVDILGYIEAQIHGGVSVKDIKSVVIHYRSKWGVDPDERALAKRLKDIGIDVSYDSVNE